MNRSHGSRRPHQGAATFAVVAIALAAGGLSAVGSARAADGVPDSQPLALLLTDHATRTAPDAGAHRLGSLSARRPLTHVHTVLPVLATAMSRDGDRWLRVALPGRPSGHTGWIAAAGTRAASTGWAIVVTLAARRVTVYERGRVARRFSAIVGKPSTPTPRGRFFVEETLALAGTAAGAPFALATSARSPVLQEFDGGPGQIALHGTGHLAGAAGTAISHGCIRLGNRAITWLAARVGAGVPVRIVA